MSCFAVVVVKNGLAKHVAHMALDIASCKGEQDYTIIGLQRKGPNSGYTASNNIYVQCTILEEQSTNVTCVLKWHLFGCSFRPGKKEVGISY
eukprot:6454744-Amphidinium_carterae.4